MTKGIRVEQILSPYLIHTQGHAQIMNQLSLRIGELTDSTKRLELLLVC